MGMNQKKYNSFCFKIHGVPGLWTMTSNELLDDKWNGSVPDVPDAKELPL